MWLLNASSSVWPDALSILGSYAQMGSIQIIVAQGHSMRKRRTFHTIAARCPPNQGWFNGVSGNQRRVKQVMSPGMPGQGGKKVSWLNPNQCFPLLLKQPCLYRFQKSKREMEGSECIFSFLMPSLALVAKRAIAKYQTRNQTVALGPKIALLKQAEKNHFWTSAQQKAYKKHPLASLGMPKKCAIGPMASPESCLRPLCICTLAPWVDFVVSPLRFATKRLESFWGGKKTKSSSGGRMQGVLLIWPGLKLGCKKYKSDHIWKGYGISIYYICNISVPWVWSVWATPLSKARIQFTPDTNKRDQTGNDTVMILVIQLLYPIPFGTLNFEGHRHLTYWLP